MAANPQFPPPGPRRRPELAPKVTRLKQGKFPWPLLAIIATAAILVALIIWLPRTPQTQAPPAAAQIPQQPTAQQIQLTNLNLQTAPVGTAIYVQGVLHNQGTTEITGVQVQATFHAADGKVLGTETSPVESLAGPSQTQAEDLTKNPIRPNQMRTFRVYFEHYPAGWNKQIPELKITEVTGTTGKPVSPNPPSPRIGM